MSEVVVIGAGMGGLAAAIRCAQHGRDVRLFEARSRAGGLASRVEHDGRTFDAGPYILLDRPGLEWAFDRLGVPLEGPCALRRIDPVYRVEFDDAPSVRIAGDLDATADALDQRWPGSGEPYRDFVDWTADVHERMRPLQWVRNPGLWDALRTGAWRNALFVFRSLHSVLASSGLPDPVCRAVGIWTHVAGQPLDEAPSVLAMVPSLIHGTGAYHPRDGIGALPEALADRARELGVDFEFETRVQRIRTDGGSACGVDLADGRSVDARAIVSNHSGVGTYLELLDTSLPPRVANRLRDLPLQSPGVAAYLEVAGDPEPPYLRFSLHDGPTPCRAFIWPAALDDRDGDGWTRARLLAPLPHDRAHRMDEAEQRDYLDRLVDAPWWRRYVEDARVLARRTAVDWGRHFNLYSDSMNPVMTARFMRRGRMAHRSPYVEDLYLAGSSTHPGQWVSFCAVSGIHAAEALEADAP